MLRKLAFSVLITACILVACGRQVTPDRTVPPGGCNNAVLPGRMLIKYRTANRMDFTNIRYFMVFNTSGNGGPPYTNGFNTGFPNYSFVIVVGGSGGPVGTVQPLVYQFIQQPGGATGSPSQILLQTSPAQLQFIQDSSGQGTEFTINFDRTIFFGIAGATASPIPQSPAPTTQPQSNWFVNFITTDKNSVPLDALGSNGVNDITFTLGLPVATCFDYLSQLTVPSGAVQAAVPAAQLAGGEIINSP